MAFAVSQNAYRFFEEDGGEAASTALGSQDTALTRIVTANSNIQLRIRLQETGSGSFSGAATDDYKLQRSINGGAFADVTTTSTAVKVNTASALTDAAATTQRLTNGTGSFFAGQQEDGNGEVTNFQHTANNYTEHVWGLTIVAAETAEGDALTFRVLLNNGTFTYNVTPTLNITEAVSVTTNPTTGFLNLVGLVSTLNLGWTTAPTAGVVAIAGQAATVSTAAILSPTAGTIFTAGLAPAVSTGGGLVQRLSPDAVVAGGSNLRDTLSNSPPTRMADIDDETTGSPGPDTEWWTAVDPTQDIDIRVSFPSPPGNLVGTQTIRAYVRGTSIPARNVRLELWENGSPAIGSPNIQVTSSVTSATGQVVTLTFQPADITTVSGANVELRIRSIAA